MTGPSDDDMFEVPYSRLRELTDDCAEFAVLREHTADPDWLVAQLVERHGWDTAFDYVRGATDWEERTVIRGPWRLADFGPQNGEGQNNG